MSPLGIANLHCSFTALRHQLPVLRPFNPRPPAVAFITVDLLLPNNLWVCCRSEVLDALNCPYKLVPGPNDERQNLFGTFADKATANEVGGVLSYLVEGFPMRLVGLDSLGHHGVGGRVCPKRLNWLNTHLSSDTSVPTIIFTHHVPMKTGAPAADADGFENGENLGAVVAQYSDNKPMVKTSYLEGILSFW